MQIAEARQKRGLTQKELAELAGVDQANISKIEKGKYNVSIDILSRVCNAMGSTITIQVAD